MTLAAFLRVSPRACFAFPLGNVSFWRTPVVCLRAAVLLEPDVPKAQGISVPDPERTITTKGVTPCNGCRLDMHLEATADYNFGFALSSRAKPIKALSAADGLRRPG
jgi:hypothetical protein